MHLQELKSLESRLLEPLSIPVIGRCLQKKAVTALAGDNSPDAVKVLAKAETSLKDEEIKEIVLDALGKIGTQNCIDAFCRVWADTRHRDLTNLLVKKGWVASRPVDVRILSALKAKQLQVVTNGGQEIVEPLLNAFQDKDSEIANRASECALSLTNPDAIDYICQKWVKNRDKLFEQLVCKGKYIARNSIELRVLTALKIDNLEVIKDGGKEIVEPLLNAFQDRNAEIANRASECAISLTNSDAIDYICQKWAESRDKTLEKLVCQGKYIAQNPIEFRVLTALKLDKLEVIQDGRKEIVEPLLSALQDRDPEIANRASECAIMFDQPEYQEFLCRLFIEKDHPIARQVTIKAQYAPREPNQRALFYFLTEQWDKYESLDIEHTLLQTAFEHSNEQLRQKITEHIRKAGRIEFLKVIVGSYQNKRLEAMADAEWETTLTILNSGKQWEEMWQLAQKAPAIWSKLSLQKLRQAAWLPKVEQEQVGFEKLKQLTDKCLDNIQSMSKLTRCQAALTPNSGETYEITFSPDGRILAAKYFSDVKLWQMPDGKLSTTLSEVGIGITFSPDGSLLASHDNEQTIKLWQMPDGKLSATLTPHNRVIKNRNPYDNGTLLANHPNATGIREIIFSPDGKIIASRSLDKQIRLWRVPDGKFLATLSGHTDQIKKITFSPDGKILASCSDYKIIKLWRIPDGKLLATLTNQTTEPNNEIEQITFSPDGKILAICSKYKAIKLWLMPDGQPLATFTGHTAAVWGISFSPDGKILASCGEELFDSDNFNDQYNIKLWQMPDCQLLHTFTGHTARIRGIIVSPNGKLLASYSHDKTIRLWQIPEKRHLATLTGHTGFIRNVAFSPNGKLLASIGGFTDDGKIRLWSSDLPRLIHKPIGKLNRQDKEFIETVLQDSEIAREERHWLEFMWALMDWHKRFDIEVGDAPQLVSTGEFDIEIEG